MGQLDLFGGPAAVPSDGRDVSVTVDPRAPSDQLNTLVAAFRARCGTDIRLGTSSWSFPGWHGLVYAHHHDAGTLAKAGLGAYAAHPLLDSVSVDRSWYAPLTERAWAEYASSVPVNFRFVVKAHNAVTRLDGPTDRRHFLDIHYASKEIVEPTLRGLGDTLGVVLFQFSPQSLTVLNDRPRFFTALRRFLSGLPSGVEKAVEIRDRALLCDEYFDALEASRAHHCFSVHPRLPDVGTQFALSRGRARALTVVRWNLGAGERYEAARRRFDPFDELKAPNPDVREQIARLVHDQRGPRPAYITINNKAEGSAPLSAIELARRLVDGPSVASTSQ
jgi:uncharacterized protein YecE (DUF72 family)